MFCIYLRTNSDLCHLQHKLVSFYNRDEKCLQRGTDWVFKYSSLRFVFKGLNTTGCPVPRLLFIGSCVCISSVVYCLKINAVIWFNKIWRKNQWTPKHLNVTLLNFFTMAQKPPNGPRPPHYGRFMTTLRHTTLGSTPLDEWSARRRDFYQTTRNTHNRQTSMPQAGFEPAIPKSERPKTYVLDSAATGIVTSFNICTN